MQERTPLPALDNAPKINNPDLPDIYSKNYTDKILKYAGLATKFPQLNTNAKTIVAAINELYAGGSGDGKHRTLTQAEYDELPEEEKNNGTIYFITDSPSVFIRPEDLQPGDAINGQLLTFFSDYGEQGIWTATSQIRNPQNGDTIVWDSSLGTWVNGQSGGGKSSLEQLTDTAINNPSNGETLVYNSEIQKWVNSGEGASQLDDLTDVDINQSTLREGQILKYTGSNDGYWENSDFYLGNISDVTIDSPTNNQVLKYDSSSNKWINSDDSEVAELDDLTDVSLHSLANGQILRYHTVQGSNTGYWENVNFPNTYISTLADVSVSSLQDYQVLRYDVSNSTWRNTNFELSNLQDTIISNPTSGQYLIYDGYQWVNADGGGGGGGSLAELSDVSIDESVLTEGQLLYYNGTEWVNNEYLTLNCIGNYGPDNEDILVYVREDEETPGVWQNLPISDAIALSKLGDVVIDDSDLQSGQVLTYNGSEWVNADGGGGGGGATYLYELDDVSISYATSGQLLQYDGSEWVNASPELSDLDDVSFSAPTNGQVLTYDNGTWVNSNASGGASELADLDDVSISSATDGQVLTYDSNSDEWVNKSLPSIPEYITDLSDVSISSATTGQILKYNNGTWENANESTGSIVSVTQIQSTGTKIATITVDSVGTDLYAPNGGGGATDLNDLTDVDIDTTTLANRDELVYNSSTSKWENKQVTVTLTQVQYDALVIAGTVDPDVFYIITDASIVPWTDLTDILTAGSTSITFSNAIITTNSTIDVYTDSDIDYNSITVTTGQVVITFDAQANNVNVKVRVS